jgi:hypothetical protein
MQHIISPIPARGLTSPLATHHSIQSRTPPTSIQTSTRQSCAKPYGPPPGLPNSLNPPMQHIISPIPARGLTSPLATHHSIQSRTPPTSIQTSTRQSCAKPYGPPPGLPNSLNPPHRLSLVCIPAPKPPVVSPHNQRPTHNDIHPKPPTPRPTLTSQRLRPERMHHKEWPPNIRQIPQTSTVQGLPNPGNNNNNKKSRCS